MQRTNLSLTSILPLEATLVKERHAVSKRRGLFRPIALARRPRSPMSGVGNRRQWEAPT